MTEEYELTERRFIEIISKALDEERPDRYVVSDSTEEDDIEGILAEEHEDMTWIDRVAERHADLLPAETVQRLHARTIAKRVESRNLQRGNRIIREAYTSPQLPLGWLEAVNYPVTVVHRVTEEGQRPRIRRERVRVGAMTSSDLRLFAAEERRAAARDFAVRNETCEAAEAAADEMDQLGLETYREWLEWSNENSQQHHA